MNKELILKAIHKTGYILENKVVKKLEDAKWNILNNRYYIDDVTDSPREIDIIAYKAYTYEKIIFYSVIIISCKKSEKNTWVFYTRSIRKDDPNIEFFPTDYCTNSGILLNMNAPNKLNKYIEEKSKNNDIFKELFNVENNVFAFQIVDEKNGEAKNDKDIYESIISTIKAMEYEKNALLSRKQEAVFYNFNLLTVFQGKMYEANFNEEEIEVVPKEHIKYINRFIVNKNEKYHLLHFISDEYLLKFQEKINKYNQEIFSNIVNMIDVYRDNFLKDYDKRNVFKEKIKKEVVSLIGIEYLFDSKYSEIKVEDILLFSNKENSKLLIYLKEVDDDDFIESINNNKSIHKYIKMILNIYCKYRGPFKFIGRNIQNA